jgi:tetratricopeptide (TPR) repeat protein
MALFGFNKQKVLAAAEKYVQQGKLQNAISEYEKALKNDSKDLTVTNTVGDLYSRLGETDKAVECFKSVGDAYAGQGFTVKAIAMYKKICKLQPALESLLKLAELYSQQGLFNDARAQYLQVAEEFLKAGELENSVRIFQKILEMDPENSNMRTRLAEVYVRLGKKTEAWQIFSAAAESLRSKGSLPAADEVLQRMLTLDPGNTYALLMQGRNMLESGDAAGAATTLAKISDIDSNPEGLRDLLKAYLQTGQLSEGGTVANKLLTVHNDLGAIASFADALMQAGQYEAALQVFDQHAERMLAENSDKVLSSLHTIIGHVRDNPDSLQKLLDLFNKAGENTHVSEVMELLAHASVQSGDLPRSRELYQKLATIEPQNPLHMQNYQQVTAQMGGTSGVKMITPEEAVVLIDDLEATAPSIHQHYSDEIALAVRSALTDAELFISYNMPAKALGPLVAALPMAPNDLRLNQRLAALHTRAGRFAEAGICCRTLQSIYSDADHPEEATRYGELADRYEERSGARAAVATPDAAPIHLDHKAQAQASAVGAESAEENGVAEFAVGETPVEEFAIETTDTTHQEPPAAQYAGWPSTEAASDTTAEATVEEPAAEAEFAVVDESSAEAVSTEPAAEGEIDLSSEWDDAITIEGDEPAVEAGKAEVPPVAAHHGEDPKVDETIEEIRFYVGHGMLEQAMAALAKLQALTNDEAKIAEVRGEVEAAAQKVEQEAVAEEPVVEDLSSDDIPVAEIEVEDAPVEAAAQEFAVEEPVAVEEPAVEEVEVASVEVKEPVADEHPVVAEAAVEAEVAAEPAPAHGALKDLVSDLESSLGDNFLPGTVTKPASDGPVPAKPAAAATGAPAAKAPVVPEAQAPQLGEFVADIEASLGEDFLKAAPVEKPKPAAKAAPAAQAPKLTPAPVPVAPVPIAAPQTAPPMAASAAASASAVTHAVPVAPVAPPPAPVAQAAHVAAPPVAAPPAAPVSTKPASDAGVDLAEMFGELKQDLEADVASSDEDPETHYNLGIAFREMGLLDEAIGELQKACQSVDRGHPFPHVMQTYTWLAQCFLDKGVPEAAVPWYTRALNIPGIAPESRIAVNYEIGAAYESAGDKAQALKFFTDVYGSNIDYRDVAERIKALKS